MAEVVVEAVASEEAVGDEVVTEADEGCAEVAAVLLEEVVEEAVEEVVVVA